MVLVQTACHALWVHPPGMSSAGHAGLLLFPQSWSGPSPCPADDKHASWWQLPWCQQTWTESWGLPIGSSYPKQNSCWLHRTFWKLATWKYYLPNKHNWKLVETLMSWTSLVSPGRLANPACHSVFRFFADASCSFLASVPNTVKRCKQM